MAKMLFDLQRGVIEIDGEEKFVERVYADIKETMLGKLSAATQFSQESSGSEEDSASTTGKRGRRRTKGSGPSCASRIDALKTENFFDDLRTSKEVGEKLREKGTAYEGKQIAAALIHMTTVGKLRRIQQGGVWKYQKP